MASLPWKDLEEGSNREQACVHTARHLDTYLKAEKSLRPCYFIRIQYPWLPSRRKHETHGERWLKDEQNVFWPAGTATAGLRLSLGTWPRGLPDLLAVQDSWSREAHVHQPLLCQEFPVSLLSFNWQWVLEKQMTLDRHSVFRFLRIWNPKFQDRHTSLRFQRVTSFSDAKFPRRPGLHSNLASRRGTQVASLLQGRKERRG